MAFSEELKRRNVFRASVIYLIVAWLIMQVADTVFPALNLAASAAFMTPVSTPVVTLVLAPLLFPFQAPL